MTFVSRNLSPRTHPQPGFLDIAQSLEVAWEVWSATEAENRYIRRVAQHRLERLVALARQKSPFYRNLYRGLPDGDIRLADLPVVTKSGLMAEFDAVLTDHEVTRDRVERFIADADNVGRLLDQRYAVWTSSGTTGEPGLFLQDSRAVAVYDALEVIRFRRLASPAILTAALLAGDRYALVAATGGHFASFATAQRLRLLYPWLADSLRIFSILQPTSELVTELNAYQPTLLASYPTAVSLLADERRAGRLAINPSQIWTGGERLSTIQRTHIADTFGCDVHDAYGASEFLAIAWDCAHGALHVNSDWVLLEAVDDAYAPVEAGAPSHTVLLTNLANHIQPLVRYDLGDSVTMLDHPCECGSAFPAVRVEGRCDDAIRLRNDAEGQVTLLPLALTTVLEEEAGVSRFQLLQKGPAELLLRLDSQNADSDAGRRCCDSLRRYLRTHEVPNVALSVERCSLERHPVSGKLKRVVGMRESL